MLTPDFLNFLYELSQNNNRDWFEKNKKRYESTVKKPFEGFVGALIREVQAFEGPWPLVPQKCIFRIHRDVRFSKDKRPYKEHVSAVFTGGGPQKTSDQVAWPGYYMQIEAGQIMLGGGLYEPDKVSLQRIREAIAADPDGFKAIADAPDFIKHYPKGLMGDRNKILPPKLKAAAAQEDRIFQKQFYFMTELDPELALQPDAAQQIGQYFRAGQAANLFLRRAVGLER
jgi:uncharacterized protein (TIGR02453 family)